MNNQNYDNYTQLHVNVELNVESNAFSTDPENHIPKYEISRSDEYMAELQAAVDPIHFEASAFTSQLQVAELDNVSGHQQPNY